jgi:hypothetical protein
MDGVEVAVFDIVDSLEGFNDHGWGSIRYQGLRASLQRRATV